MDRGDFDTALDFDPRAKHGVLIFAAPRPNSPADFGDWLLILNTDDFAPLQVCVIGSGYDYSDPPMAVFASEVALEQAGYRHRRSRPGATLTASWEVEKSTGQYGVRS